MISYLEGGYRFFTQGAYFGPSNPSELGFYVGMLPLIAVLALCVPSWRSWLPKGERRPWYALILVGGVAATAAGTPLEHVFDTQLAGDLHQIELGLYHVTVAELLFK